MARHSNDKIVVDMKLTDNWKVALVTLFVFAIIMLVSAYKIGPEIMKKGTFYMKEEPLEKITLQLKAGELYKYKYTLGNQSLNISYATMQGQNCIIITMKEIKSGDAAVCVKKDGTDNSGSNLSLSNPLIQLYKPWMLAVKSGWSWKVEMISSISQNLTMGEIVLSETGETVYNGRVAFIVTSIEPGMEGVKMTIDKEKRVLLKEEGKGYVIELVSAPFPLVQ